MSTASIPKPVLTELNRQLNHELHAAHAYSALANWCQARTLKGFAGFFEKQAGEERQHAAKMIRHVLDRGASPELAAIPAPAHAFGSLLEVVLQAQKMEQANTQGINALYEAALAGKDYPAQVLMHWFISEQVEEEAWAAELVERVRSASCAGSLQDLDRHLEKVLGSDSK
jgi:ferritin